MNCLRLEKKWCVRNGDGRHHTNMIEGIVSMPIPISEMPLITATNTESVIIISCD